MRALIVGILFCAGFLSLPVCAQPIGDSRGDELAQWIDESGQTVWGQPPPPCDDLTFARRVYLDVLGRVPSVAEVRDFQSLGDNRRNQLIEQIVFGEGVRAATYQRLSAAQWARHWRRLLIPPGTTVLGSSEPLEQYLAAAFESRTPYDEIVRGLVRVSDVSSAGGYYQLIGGLPENYAGHLSRFALGIRIECAQCHHHPFADWKQSDFWGLAAFYGDIARMGDDASASKPADQAASIVYEGEQYQAKFLWTDRTLPTSGQSVPVRSQLATWLTSRENPNFSATAANRIWEFLVGHGAYADVENLDMATASEREWLDELGKKFASDGFDTHRMIAAICKTTWYQAESEELPPDAELTQFARTLKVLSPEQVFDSLEQSLILSVSRIDPASSRWTGDRTQLVSRLSETVGATPEDFASGIPQALMLMNGKMTSDAIDLERSRLLRAIVESPFFDTEQRIKTLYLAVLTRVPREDESDLLTEYLDSQSDAVSRQRAYGEILWALLNSPEFVLCR